MTTYYVGLRDTVLKGRSDTPNTYTGLLGKYSNWDLMYTSHVLDGAPDKNHVPGVPQDSGGGEGDVQLSAMFAGTLYFVYPLAGAYNAVAPASVSYFYGAFPDYQYWGLITNYSGEDGTVFGHRPIVSTTTWGHLAYSPLESLDQNGNPVGLGPSAPYREWDYYYHGLPNTQAFNTARVGHVAHFTTSETGDVQGTAGIGESWDTYTPAASFGSFQPYLYKGVNAAFGNGPGGSGEEEFVTYGHIYEAANSVGTATDFYGDEHTREWFGVPAAAALNGGVPANGNNSYSAYAPKL